MRAALVFLCVMLPLFDWPASSGTQQLSPESLARHTIERRAAQTSAPVPVTLDNFVRAEF